MLTSLPLKKAISVILCLILILQTSCSSGIPTSTVVSGAETNPLPTPSLMPIFELPTQAEILPTSTAAAQPTPPQEQARNDFIVRVDASKDVHPISQLIYGVSDASPEILKALRPTLNSWGGNPITRYNWRIGNAWNAGSDWFYRNGNYGFTEGSASQQFIKEANDAGIVVRLAIPTLGWVAKDDNNATCSFPDAEGNCGDAGGASCLNPGPTADPETANVPSDPSSIQEWLADLSKEQGYDIQYIAMDNEPELWGITHYDVHPTCTTYREMLTKYLEYSRAAHESVPEAELVGPVTCCWFYYWNSPAGEVDKLGHGNLDFLPWFLENVRKNDEKTGWRSLHVLDIHYYPEGLYNDNVDGETASRRLRSTRSLWDDDYVDESWIAEPIYLIPRMKQLLEEYYPGTKLGISEWNWGADGSINGALAIADVLGIFGREDLHYAAYWRYPELNSPGFYAFKMYTNFDGKGSRFGSTSVSAESMNQDVISSYAALDETTGDLHVMLINKNPQQQASVQVQLANFLPESAAKLYRYESAYLNRIQGQNFDRVSNAFDISLPPYSVTLLVIPGKVP